MALQATFKLRKAEIRELVEQSLKSSAQTAQPLCIQFPLNSHKLSICSHSNP